MSKYLDKYVFMYANMFVLFAAINTALYKMNPSFNILSKVIKDRTFRRIFYILVGLLAVYLILKRETFLPFLGESVVPTSVFKNHNNNMNSEDPNRKMINLTITAPNAEKIIWWAASEDQHTIAKNPDEAYKEYQNSGVSTVSTDGTVKIVFPCPTQYKIPSGRTLKKHLHYRETHGGMLGEVKTIFLDC
jgi:uncharacterized membrane protein YuzA (DUF378 family)